MTKQLSNATSYAVESQNVAGTETPILTFQPDDGLHLIVQGMVSAGKERGFPLYMDLNQADGSDLPEDTELVFKYEAPGQDDATSVTQRLDHIRAWNALSINEQQNEEYIDRLKVLLKNTDSALAQGEVPQVTVRDIDELRVEIKSSAQVDWSQSRLYIDRNAVREV